MARKILTSLLFSFVLLQLTRIFQIVQGKTYYPLLVLMAIFFPLQGFFNAIIYLRPRYIKLLRERPPEIENKGFFGICWIVLFNKSGEGSKSQHVHSRMSAHTNTETGH